MARFLVEIEEGITVCEKCPLYNNNVKCAKVLCEDKNFDYDFLKCTKYNLESIKITEIEKYGRNSII